MNIQDLFAEFPKQSIHWRAQSVTRDGTKAMALAYIDARDVMERLDEVCGPDNWQSRYPHAGAKTICEIGIKIGGEWVWKANGSGDTDIEGEKGAASGAFKRAAVLWGIGRYLYDLKSPWVPCESYEKNGKRHWKKWTADPWNFVGNQPAPKPANKPAMKVTGKTPELWVEGMLKLIENSADLGELSEAFEANKEALDRLANSRPDDYDQIEKARGKRFSMLSQAPQQAAE